MTRQWIGQCWTRITMIVQKIYLDRLQFLSDLPPGGGVTTQWYVPLQQAQAAQQALHCHLVQCPNPSAILHHHQVSPGATLAASMVNSVQNFSSNVIGDLNAFTGNITEKTNPVPKTTTRSSGGGGGRSCACACACAGCACACAGGGR